MKIQVHSTSTQYPDRRPVNYYLLEADRFTEFTEAAQLGHEQDLLNHAVSEGWAQPCNEDGTLK